MIVCRRQHLRNKWKSAPGLPGTDMPPYKCTANNSELVMVFDGNTEICAHVQSKIDHLICLHVGNSVKYENIFTKGPVFMFLASI